VWNPEVDSFERIPSVVHATDAAVIVGVGILAALIGSTVAAAKAARVWPVRALHHR
jgi:ABC-type lipoprotein release transport system permease subunit